MRQLAAAYLARVRRLIVAMDVLYEAEMPMSWAVSYGSALSRG